MVSCARQTSAFQGVRTGLAFVALSVGLAFAGPGFARAADAPVLKAKSVWAYDWTGFYVGGHVGFSRGTVDATVFITDDTFVRQAMIFQRPKMDRILFCLAAALAPTDS